MEVSFKICFVEFLSEFVLFCFTACPEGYYGFKCENKCLCQNNSTCDNEFGYCDCLPGFQGKFCEEGNSNIKLDLKLHAV